MSIFTLSALRIFGISGIFGSILFIIGDLLYGYIPGSDKSPIVKMSTMVESRLLNAGMMGLFGCWFYSLASFHLYIALRPAGDILAIILFLSFAATMICYGISHTAYFAIASGAKVAALVGSDVEFGGKLGTTFYKRLVFITYIPVAIASLIMIYGIVAGRSLYPRWAVVILPIFTFLLKPLVIKILKGRLREIVNDSYDNMVLFIFYAISTILLWNTAVT